MSDTKIIDEKVLNLFNKVKEKQKKIAANEKVNWETNCSFGYTENINDRINLHVASDLSKLVDMYIFLQVKSEYWKDACEKLGIQTSLKWLGYKIEDWQKDIKSRVNQLQLGNERKELAVLESRLDALITIDQRRVMELEAIEKLL